MSDDRELKYLRAFYYAVVGWREYDWPEGFSRKTAEDLAENAKRVADACREASILPSPTDDSEQ